MHGIAETLPLWSVLPFVGLLLSIAMAPLFAPDWWAAHHRKVICGFGLPVGIAFLFLDPNALLTTVKDYIAFIALLGALFIITGGILVRGDFPPTPTVNAIFLGIGAVVANIIGTTGASVLLLRPLLRANAHRPNPAHVVVFFIFLVSNIGGALTPLGDPPLFLGFLHGVPFTWTLNLWPQWLFTVTLVLITFWIIDNRHWQSEADHPREPLEFSVTGGRNFIFLGGVLVAIFLPSPWRELTMITMGLLSYRLTDPKIHSENRFTFGPIEEVAVIFSGIFLTMIPALLILETHGKHAGLHEPWHFFWAAGSLSSFLDNAPTYLTFFYAILGLGLPGEVAGLPEKFLVAISLGSVFMGANSYIGNGPNFMVKAIAEEHGVKMPSFFGYMAYSGCVLVPIFILLSLVFLR